MQLLTHNLLKSPLNCEGYPLNLVISSLTIKKDVINSELVNKLLPRINIEALGMAMDAVLEHDPSLNNNNLDVRDILNNLSFVEPGSLPSEMIDFIGNVLFNIHIEKGSLICPKYNRSFEIENGIPDLRLSGEEVRELQESYKSTEVEEHHSELLQE